MKVLITYDKATGRILIVETALDSSHRTETDEIGLLWAETLPAISSSYISNGELSVRPTMAPSIDKTEITADNTDIATISNLPDPCTVTINGAATEATGGSAEICSPVAVTLQITLSGWPYLDYPLTVEAV